MNGFSERLKELRGEKSQQEVADKIGITNVSLSRYEKGERIPSADILYKICIYYRVSSDYILGINGDLNDYEALKRKNKQLEEKINKIKNTVG